MDAEPTAFSFKQVEAILAAEYGVAPTKRGTFMARLQQLQRMGLPRGTNVGRSARARYHYWQLAEMAVYLDLLNCGLSPMLLKIHFSESPVFSGSGVGEGVERPTRGDVFFLPALRALDHLKSSKVDNSGPHFGDHIFRFRRVGLVVDALAEESSLAINLSARLRSLKRHVSEIVPAFAGLEAFPAPTIGQGPAA